MPWFLLLILGISFGQECVLEPESLCSGGDATTLTISDLTPEACAEACTLSSSGCCAFSSTSETCTISATGSITTGVETDFASICTAGCVDREDDVWSLGVPFVSTCSDLFFEVAQDVGLGSSTCNTATGLLPEGSTLRNYCCASCGLYEGNDPGQYTILDGQCIDSDTESMPSYVSQKFVSFYECVGLCSELKSCSGVTFSPENRSTCKIHIHTEYHNDPLLVHYTSHEEEDGHADSSDDNRQEGVCALQITQQPSQNPSTKPTVLPSGNPSVIPTTFPSTLPSTSPSYLPSTKPSVLPSTSPTVLPSHNPSVIPSTSPSTGPSVIPSVDPTVQPTVAPTTNPSTSPSVLPSNNPSTLPTTKPSVGPTTTPSTTPSVLPSTSPSVLPTVGPTQLPSVIPTTSPSVGPTVEPTKAPSTTPSSGPSNNPTTKPSKNPTTRSPTANPSVSPSHGPSTRPSITPTGPPSAFPSQPPSTDPTVNPTDLPSVVPSTSPSVDPSIQPSAPPSVVPSTEPSNNPSVAPSVRPSNSPTVFPSHGPSVDPSTSPSVLPSVSPSHEPSVVPSTFPSTGPSVLPSTSPSVLPSTAPSTDPSCVPTAAPSVEPTELPSAGPSVGPSDYPSYQPTITNPCSPSDMNILGSDFITLQEGYSSFTNDELTLGLGFPDRYTPLTIDFSDAVDDGASFTGAYGGFWETFMDTTEGNECLRILQGKFNWEDVVDNSYMGLGLHYQGEESYFMNTLTLHFKENATSYNFKMEISRDIYVDIPWLLKLVKEVSLNITFNVAVPTHGPSTAPSVVPSTKPSNCPSVIPSVCPSHNPSVSPSVCPSVGPTVLPSSSPSTLPSTGPSNSPSVDPTTCPSFDPSTSPSTIPSTRPSVLPSTCPSVLPTTDPSTIPSTQPSCVPSGSPSVSPTTFPSKQPSVLPTTSPSVVPSVSPSTDPSNQPSVNPTVCPTSFPSGSPTPREDISFDVSVEAWQFFTLGEYIDASAHSSDNQLIVIQTTDAGSFLLNTATVTNGQILSDSDLALTSYSPVVVSTNTTTEMIIESNYKRYTFNLLVIHPDACIGEWSDWNECSNTCDEGEQSRTFSIITPADPFGEGCDFEDNKVQTQTCEVVQCPNLDKIVMEFAVAEPNLSGQTKVTMNYTTYVQWPWKVIEQNHTCFQIIDDTTGSIVSESDDWYIIDDCIPSYIYGKHEGACVGVSEGTQYIPAIYIRGIDDIENTICEVICNALDECEAFDVYYDRPEAERRVCEILGQNIESTHNVWVRENFDVEPWFFFRFNVFEPEAPTHGNGEENASCYIRNTPVYEGDCIQKWHGNFLVDATCDVSGSYTLQTCTEHQVTQAVDVSEIVMDISLDTACGSVVGSLDLVGDISTFADDSYTLQSNIYHVEDLVYSRSVITSRVELTDLVLVGLVAQQNFEPADIFSDVTTQSVSSLSVPVGAVTYETVVEFSFRLDNILGSGDGLTTIIFATFEASYVNGLRRQLLISNEESPVGVDHTLVVFPGPCYTPHAPYNHLLTESCGYDLRISVCDQGQWIILEDNIMDNCDEDPTVHISEEVPAGYGDIRSRNSIIVDKESGDNENIWVTVTVITIMASIAGLCVYLYIDCFGGRSNTQKSAIVKFQNSIDNLDIYETHKREPTTKSSNLEFDDNTSEISVSSTIKDEDTMDVVFGHLFNPNSEQL